MCDIRKTLKKIKPYAIGIAVPLVIGGSAAFITRDSMDLYQNLQTPPLAPPRILFPIVWSLLYVLMGIGSTAVYKAGADPAEKRRALFVYGAQLLFNFFWSIWFFEKQAYLFSFIWLVALWILIAGMIISFYKISKPAAWLQIPYLLWVTFAGYLNFAVYLLNR